MKQFLKIAEKKQFVIVSKKHTVLPVICLAAFLCCGCAAGTQPENVSDTGAADSAKITSMESTAVVDYAVPQLTPNVLVNLVGYQVGNSKRAVVKGRQIPETFRLVDADTGEIVFTGRLREEECGADSDIAVAYADFSSWEQTGNYYVECQYIGRSFPFSIEEDLYENLFGETCARLGEACEAQTIPLSDVAELLLAYEWYPDIFPDRDGNQIPDIMEKIAAWISATAESAVEPGQEALYAVTLAKFSYLYQKFDRQYATDCLKKASVVYEQTQSTMQKDAECFYALAELYRATGLYNYRRQIEEYKAYFENHADFAEQPGYLYGAMTYIATRQKVDMDLCGLFMDALMSEGEEISNVYEAMISPVNAHNNGADDLLRHAVNMACSNYVMNNYQYNHIMEEFLHYLRGRNQQSVDFCAGGQSAGAEGGYLLLLAQLVNVEQGKMALAAAGENQMGGRE